jgi:UrcA family protein
MNPKTRSTARRVCRFSMAAVAASISFAMASDTAHAAGSGYGPPAAIVTYSDLNLASGTGVKTLYRRLSAAAAKVCRHFNRRDTAQRAKWQQCHAEALSAAVLDVNVPGLLAMHTKSPRSPGG